MTSVTGSGHRRNLLTYLDIVRRNATKNPLLVGFGISAPEDASGIAESADGVIVGSALLRLLGQKCSPADLAKWVRDFRESLP